jgi:ankyrin repeat protein
MTIPEILFSANVKELEKSLRDNPSVANQEISLPDNPATAHPLHRVCDGVHDKHFSEEAGIELAKILIQHGSNVNAITEPGKDSPLTAACSLYCDGLAILYLEHGARIDHPGCHGGTALHWASWCGRDAIVRKIVTMNPETNKLCVDFKSTPLFWAIHGYKFGGKENQHNQLNCARILLEHGADPNIPNLDGTRPKQLIEPSDKEFAKLFENIP